jgi:enoyl-CoA hydratase/carnithine racemase
VPFFAEYTATLNIDLRCRVVLWHSAGNSFSAGNDIEDFMKNPPAPGKSPQAQLIHALINFEKPLVAAVQGAAIGGRNDAGETAKFQLPFVNLALVPEFGSSHLLPVAFRIYPRSRADPAGWAI